MWTGVCWRLNLTKAQGGEGFECRTGGRGGGGVLEPRGM